MNDLNVVISAFGGDTLSVLATKEATSRFNVWGEVSWARKKSTLELPDDRSLIQSIKYEAAGYKDDGTATQLSAFVTTGFETMALFRMSEDGVALTVWGNSRASVDATIGAYLKAWPPERAESDDEPGSGLYV